MCHSFNTMYMYPVVVPLNSEIKTSDKQKLYSAAGTPLF